MPPCLRGELRLRERRRILHQCLSDFCRSTRHMNPRSLHGLDLLRRSSLPAGDDRARVSHAPPRRRGLARDKAHYRLLHVRLDVLRRCFFGAAADLADHDDGFRLRISVEQRNRVYEVCPDDRVATDTDGRRLPDAARRQLIHGFIRQRARARHDAHVAFLMNAGRHDADLAAAGRDNTRAVRPDQPRILRLQVLPRLHHVERRNALRDAHDQRNTRVGRFHDGVRRTRRRHENHRRIGAGLRHRFSHCVEDGPAFMSGATLARSHATHHLRSVRLRSFGVEGSFPARQSLHNQSRRFINQDAHLTPFAATTTLSAASFMVSATMKFSPLAFRISRPCSTFVPSSRSTMGNWMLVFFAALTTPLASVSTRRMPPKMLISTAFTFLSASRISNACVTCSSLAPPPTSRKLAGMPPAY